MSYRKTCLTKVHVHMRTGFTGWHVMQEGMYYSKTCGSGDHIFHENMCYERSCLIHGHVLQADMFVGSHVLWGYISNERLFLKGGHVLQ